MEMLTCVQCDEKFKPGNWYGCAGNETRKHKLEPRTFYSDNDSLQVNAIPARNMLNATGGAMHIPGAIVTFNGGLFRTDDPELQEVLARRCPLSKEEYMQKRLTPEMKAARQKAVIDEQQDLINKLKSENAKLKSGKSPEPDADPVLAGARGRTRAKAN